MVSKPRLKSAEVKNEAFDRKNKKLKKFVHRQAASTATGAEFITIPKPNGNFKLQKAMQV